MAYIATNSARSTLAVSLGGTVGDTTLQIQVGDVSLFPVINDAGVGSDYTLLTLRDSSGNTEIVKVDRHDTGSASFTVQRAQEGTSARVWQAGDSVSLRLTAGVVTQTYTHPSQGTGAHAATAISVTPAGNIGATNVQAALEELDSEKSATGHTHAASAITVTPTGGIAATTVQSALAELDSEKASTGDIANMLETSDIGSTVQAYDADTAKTDVEQAWSAQQTAFDGTLTDGATIDWNGDTHGQIVSVTLGGNRTLNAPTNINENALYVLTVIQDGTGGHTLDWNAAYKFPGGTVPTVTATAGAVDVFSFIGGAGNTLRSFGQDVK